MDLLQIVLGVLLGVVALLLVVVVMAQPGKDKGLSASIGGGSSDTYFGKSKSVSKEKILSSVTVVLCVLLLGLLLALVCTISASAK